MECLYVSEPQALDQAAARWVARELLRRPTVVLGLPTGSTPIGMYHVLVRMAQEGLVSFAQATTFNLDEYVGLDAAYSQSYAAFMREHFWKWVDLPDKAIHIPCGTAPDLREECARYDEELEKAGGIDIQILGLGLNGHIGFNEPSHDLLIRTHVVHLTPETVEANAYHFSGVHFVPRQALTMGIGSIMQSGKILLLVSGAQKKEILNKTLFGPVSTEVPASILQLHPNLTVLTDIRLDQS